MRKIAILLTLVTGMAFGQNIKKTELNNNILQNTVFIKEEKDWGGPYKIQFEDNFDKNEKIYIFEMEYKGKVFFREAIKKDVAKGKDSGLLSSMFRFKTSFYVPYDIFDKDTKLDMLERNYVVNEVDGVRYLNYHEFEPIVSSGRKYIINPNVPEYIKLRVYELEFQ